MRRLVLFLVQIAFMVSLEAQTFYYYKGERIPISIDTVRCTIFFSSDHVLRETGILKSEEGMSGKNFCIIGQKQLDEVGLKSGATEILSVEPVIAPSQTPVSNLFLCKNTNGKRYRFFERFCCKEWLQGGTSSGINAFVVCTIYFNLFCWQFYRNGKQMF